MDGFAEIGAHGEGRTAQLRGLNPGLCVPRVMHVEIGLGWGGVVGGFIIVLSFIVPLSACLVYKEVSERESDTCAFVSLQTLAIQWKQVIRAVVARKASP